MKVKTYGGSRNLFRNILIDLARFRILKIINQHTVPDRNAILGALIKILLKGVETQIPIVDASEDLLDRRAWMLVIDGA